MSKVTKAFCQPSVLIETPDYTFLGNCPPSPPLSQHFALSEKQVLMLTYGRGRWAVSQKCITI